MNPKPNETMKRSFEDFFQAGITRNSEGQIFQDYFQGTGLQSYPLCQKDFFNPLVRLSNKNLQVSDEFGFQVSLRNLIASCFPN